MNGSRNYARVNPKNYVRIFPKPHSDEIAEIVLSMRQEDQDECMAFGLSDHEAAVHFDIAASDPASSSYIAYRNERPTFLFGARPDPERKNEYWLFGVGTNDARFAIPVVTRFVRRQWLPELFDTLGVKCLWAMVPQKSVHSSCWLMRLGMRRLETANVETLSNEPIGYFVFDRGDYHTGHHKIAPVRETSLPEFDANVS